jgi:hypothetical protein
VGTVPHSSVSFHRIAAAFAATVHVGASTLQTAYALWKFGSQAPALSEALPALHS